MSVSIEELRNKHREEIEKFVEDCPHTEVKIYDKEAGFRHRKITLICERCGLNLLGFEIEGDWSYLAYVRDCVNGHPSKRKEVANS